MGTHMGHVFTLANSIIGVSVLAMPFCFRQCGIVLSVLMLLLSSYISRLACHYLMKSAIAERMKNFEMLAFRSFGPTGKIIVEMSIVGFMLGTCVAFFVIIGDLGPDILGPILGLEHPTALRPSVLIGTAIFVVLPLGLLKNVDSLNGICAASLAFYGVLVLKVFFESALNLFGTDVWSNVYYWRPLGILRCIPIFSMALSCQTQLFEIFGSLPSTPLDRANAVVKSAVNLTTFLYISVGFFGYVAYANTLLTGNVMMNFSPGASSDIIKIFFLLSVAMTFPLVIFPCRASIYSFLYSKHSYDGFGSAHIPETRFQCITLVIVTSSLIIGLLIPNIELVLGLVGSTLGVFICVITPGLIFTTVSHKRNNERLLAQILVGAGLVIMVLGTYANLFATEETLIAPEPKDEAKVAAKEEKAIDLHLPIEELNRDVAKMQEILKNLKKEDEARKAIQQAKSDDEKMKSNVESAKNSSPGVISDQNPQPVKVDEGPKPQPVAPEPPEEPQKKAHVDIPESLQNLEIPKKVEKDSSPLDQPPDPPRPLPEVVKPIEALEKANAFVAVAKKESDPVHPIPPVEVPKQNPPDKVPQDLSSALVEPVKPLPLPEEKPVIKSNTIQPEKKVEEKINVDEKRIRKSKSHENQLMKELEVRNLSDEPIGNLSMSIKQGLPLPLAIKGLDKKVFAEKTVSAELKTSLNDSSRHGVEFREKRDLEALEIEGEIKSGEGPVNGFSDDAKNLNQSGAYDASESSQNDPNSLHNSTIIGSEVSDSSESKRTLEPVETLTSNESHKQMYIPNLKKGTDNDEEEEECPKTEAEKELLKQEPSLIKAPSKLTNEDTILPVHEPLPPEMNEPELLIHDRVGKQKK